MCVFAIIIIFKTEFYPKVKKSYTIFPSSNTQINPIKNINTDNVLFNNLCYENTKIVFLHRKSSKSYT